MASEIADGQLRRRYVPQKVNDLVSSPRKAVTFRPIRGYPDRTLVLTPPREIPYDNVDIPRHHGASALCSEGTLGTSELAHSRSDEG